VCSDEMTNIESIAVISCLLPFLSRNPRCAVLFPQALLLL